MSYCCDRRGTRLARYRLPLRWMPQILSKNDERIRLYGLRTQVNVRISGFTTASEIASRECSWFHFNMPFCASWISPSKTYHDLGNIESVQLSNRHILEWRDMRLICWVWPKCQENPLRTLENFFGNQGSDTDIYCFCQSRTEKPIKVVLTAAHAD